jgi:hypothetical protein
LQDFIIIPKAGKKRRAFRREDTWLYPDQILHGKKSELRLFVHQTQ